MKKISSELTPILKYIVPWITIVALVFGTIGALYAGQYATALGVVIVGTPIVGFMKTMLMDLKRVFLDKERKVIIVQGFVEDSVPYDDVKEILRPWTPPYLVTVRLSKSYSFGYSFVFVSRQHPMAWDESDYGEELKTKIRK